MNFYTTHVSRLPYHPKRKVVDFHRPKIYLRTTENHVEPTKKGQIK